MSKREDTAPPENGRSSSKPTNEYVLNVAFYSFVGFMSVQAVFALIANSEAMLVDSEAMSVDAFTYLFNLWAERIKREPLSGHNSSVVLLNPSSAGEAIVSWVRSWLMTTLEPPANGSVLPSILMRSWKYFSNRATSRTLSSTGCVQSITNLTVDFFALT
jgi:hypothetical protein